MAHNCMDCPKVDMLQKENGQLRQELSDLKNGICQLAAKGWKPHPAEKPIGIRLAND